MDPLRVAELERRLGYRFRDPRLLEQALTHASYANEHPPAADHSRLAFLGDAALALVVAERLMADDPAATVGALTSQRAELVTGPRLARWAVGLDLGALLRLGRGEDQSGGRARESILASALEAVLGAIYAEGGLDALRDAVGRLIAW
ncbi:MAG TPA: ribonuclease III domain-containing protein [Methylomirabilota bacterium]